MIVGVNADAGRYAHRLLGDDPGIQLRVFDQHARGGKGVIAAGTDGDNVVVGLDHVAGAGNHEKIAAIRDNQQRFQPAQHAIRAPIFGELHRRPLEIAVELLELGLKLLE